MSASASYGHWVRTGGVGVATRALDLPDPCSETPPTLLDGQRLTPATVQRACAQAQQHTLGLHALQPDDDLGY
jgi:hypothetical protein